MTTTTRSADRHVPAAIRRPRPAAPDRPVPPLTVRLVRRPPLAHPARRHRRRSPGASCSWRPGGSTPVRERADWSATPPWPRRSAEAADFGEVPTENVVVTRPGGRFDEATARELSGSLTAAYAGVSGVAEVGEPDSRADGGTMLLPVQLAADRGRRRRDRDGRAADDRRHPAVRRRAPRPPGRPDRRRVGRTCRSTSSSTRTSSGPSCSACR